MEKDTNSTMEKSRFFANLFSHIILLLILRSLLFSLKLTYYAENILFEIIQTLSIIITWSLYIGIVYAAIRQLKIRIIPLEWYYQHIPFGWNSINKNNSFTEIEDKEIAENYQFSFFEGVKWDKLLSVEYLRYAGALLIISSIFSFLFKIEWALHLKIIITLCGALFSLIGSEFSTRRSFTKIANFLFLTSFALSQFGTSLLYTYENFYLYQNINLTLTIKIVLTLLYAPLLFRHTLSFTPVIFLIIAYLGLSSLSLLKATFLPDHILIFCVTMSILSGFLSITKARPFLLLINTSFVTLYTLPLINKFISIYPFINTNYESDFFDFKIKLFSLFLFVIVTHLVSGALIIIKKHKASLTSNNTNYSSSIAEYLISHTIFNLFILDLSQQISWLSGYKGATLVSLTIFSFASFLFLRKKDISNHYTEILINYSLLVSSLGMFLQTEGAWSAIIFLIFACCAIYASIILGTKRTSIYSFVILTISLFKLYIECNELFNSVSGTSIVLLIGLILIALSFKLEKIKELLKKQSPD